MRSFAFACLPTTAHGFRHLASTALNSQGYNRDWIEMQLAHWNEGVRGAYNKAQWLPERRAMMQWRTPTGLSACAKSAATSCL
jgi:integrase